MAVLDADDGVLSPFMAVIAVTSIIQTRLISLYHVGVGVLCIAFVQTAPLIYVLLFDCKGRMYGWLLFCKS